MTIAHGFKSETTLKLTFETSNMFTFSDFFSSGLAP